MLLTKKGQAFNSVTRSSRFGDTHWQIVPKIVGYVLLYKYFLHKTRVDILYSFVDLNH